MHTGSLALGVTAIPAWLPLLTPTSYEMIPLRRNIGIFKERGGTIGWLVQKDGIVVIDSQWKEQAQNLIAEIRKMDDSLVRYLINTHHHGDHTSGNIAFKEIVKHVLAHENSKVNQIKAAELNNTVADQLYPDMTYNDRWQQEVGDEIIDIQYWGPGHTNGDSIIHFQKANIVHCGDLVFNRRFPYIDKTNGAMIENWIQILQQMQTYFDMDTIFIFGHARDGFSLTGSKEDLNAFQDYLTALLDFVSAEIQAGKNKAEILKAKTIPGATEWTGDGIERSLTAAMTELGLKD